MSEQELTSKQIRKRIRNLQFQQNRLKMKVENPEKYQEELLKQRERSRNHYANLDPERKALVIKRILEVKKKNRPKIRAQSRASYRRRSKSILAKKKEEYASLNQEEKEVILKKARTKYHNLPKEKKKIILERNKKRSREARAKNKKRNNT